MKPSRLETTCSVTFKVLASDSLRDIAPQAAAPTCPRVGHYSGRQNGDGLTPIFSVANAPVPCLTRLRRGGVNLGAIVEAGVPVATPFSCEVHEMPDGIEEVDAALFNVRAHPRMRG